MLITLFTDAGYCPKTRIGTWAAWAKHDGATIRHSGVFKTLYTSSDVAEIYAGLNGLAFVFASVGVPPKSKIIHQMDCQPAIDCFQGKGYKTKEASLIVGPARVFFHTLLREYPTVVIEFRHVEGHRGDVTPRNAVNTWCDRECTRLLNLARRQPPQQEIA